MLPVISCQQNSLSKNYEVSRVTVRNALNALVEKSWWNVNQTGDILWQKLHEALPATRATAFMMTWWRLAMSRVPR